MPPVVDKNNIKNFINETVAKNEVTIFTKSTCPYCKKVSKQKILFAINSIL